MTAERVERRLAAVLAADVAGYSRLMAADEVGTLDALKALRREVVDPAIAEHKGRIVKTTGDGMLVEFASAVDAVTCAMAVQAAMAARAGNLSFRIGINVGDIIIDGDDIFGDGVNVAARVENECAPGGVSLSANAFEQIRNKTAFGFDDLGERSLKNIDRPVRIYTVRGAASQSASAGAIAVPETGKPLPLPDKPSIAVLPFQNMSGDPEQEYFADGMVDEIITKTHREARAYKIKVEIGRYVFPALLQLSSGLTVASWVAGDHIQAGFFWAGTVAGAWAMLGSAFKTIRLALPIREWTNQMIREHFETKENWAA